MPFLALNRSDDGWKWQINDELLLFHNDFIMILWLKINCWQWKQCALDEIHWMNETCIAFWDCMCAFECTKYRSTFLHITFCLFYSCRISGCAVTFFFLVCVFFPQTIFFFKLCKYFYFFAALQQTVNKKKNRRQKTPIF